jgi:hypothetical protein
VGDSWDELKYIRQAVTFLVIGNKPRKTLENITRDLCPILSIQQLYRISTMWVLGEAHVVLMGEREVDCREGAKRPGNSAEHTHFRAGFTRRMPIRMGGTRVTTPVTPHFQASRQQQR